jgi:hypothetical protein
MKKIYLFITLLVSTGTFVKAQEFVRIYNSSRKKIATGRLVDEHQNDSFLVIKKEKVVDTIPVQQIAYIKTKHSIGNNILIGAIIGAPVGAILGGAAAGTADEFGNDFTGETSTPDVGAGIAVGLLSGAATGAAVGAITGAFKNSKTITINGDIQQWLKVRALL